MNKRTNNAANQLARALQMMLDEFQGYTDENNSADEDWRESRAIVAARKALDAHRAEKKRLASRARAWREITRKAVKS